MARLSSAIALSLVAAAAGLPALAAPPQRVEITYELSRNGSVVAEVIERLEHDGKAYQLQETWRGRGMFSLKGEAVRTSRGTIAPDGLRPRAFEDKRSGRDPRKAEFDPASPAPTAERQDRLSFVWTMVFAPPKGAVAYAVADGKGVTHYAFQPAGREKVKVPAGEFEALKMAKRRDDPKDKVTEIWLAADRGNIPVKILYVDKDGTRVEQQAIRIATP